MDYFEPRQHLARRPREHRRCREGGHETSNATIDVDRTADAPSPHPRHSTVCVERLEIPGKIEFSQGDGEGEGPTTCSLYVTLRSFPDPTPTKHDSRKLNSRLLPQMTPGRSSKRVNLPIRMAAGESPQPGFRSNLASHSRTRVILVRSVGAIRRTEPDPQA